jgi:phosphopantothenate-cysteine ligase
VSAQRRLAGDGAERRSAASAFSTTSVPVSATSLPQLTLTSCSGTRGATSAEYFLNAGYGVLFLHRQHSLQPFSRHYSHSTHPFLDFLDVSPSGEISVTAGEREGLSRVLAAYKHAQDAGALYTLPFITVNEYLWLLRAVSQEISVLGRHAMFYLAAAVSDFFLPTQKMVRLIEAHGWIIN